LIAKQAAMLLLCNAVFMNNALQELLGCSTDYLKLVNF